MEIFFYWLLVLLPGLMGVGSLFGKAKISIFGIGAVFLGFLSFGGGVKLNSLSWFISLFILFLSGIVHLFSIRYMSGDRQFNSFFVKLGLLTSSLLLMIGADHLLLFLTCWALSNLLLVYLMIHKSEWSASLQSGLLLLRYSLLGTAFLGLAVFLFGFYCNTLSLQEIIGYRDRIPPVIKEIILFCLMTSALVQSGVWPFHKWLLSSLNSPTPVSGFMHAGLVNGGGFLLARFAPLFLETSWILDSLFIVGGISVVLGTFWKLMQSSIKSMLACSTMAQMGFMLMQCGLGLFPAALAHLCSHGLFKCSLFLHSGSAIERRRSGDRIERKALYAVSWLAGLAGVYGFSLWIDLPSSYGTTQMILMVFAWISSSHIAYLLFDRGGIWISVGVVAPFLFGILYGSTAHWIESFFFLEMGPLLPLRPVHMIGSILIVLFSIGSNLNLFSSRRLYVAMMNMSQSDKRSVTTDRMKYRYTK